MASKPVREYRALFEFEVEDGKKARIYARLEATSHAEALSLAEESIELSNSGAVLVGVYTND